LRQIGDILRRGFDNTVANWQLMLVRIAGILVILAAVAAAVIAVVVPLAISIGISKDTFLSGSDPREIMTSLVADHGLLIIGVLVGFGVAIFVAMLVFTFVEAGVVSVYVDGERAASSTSSIPTRDHFRVFSGERWLAGAKAFWKPVFGVFNIVWGVAALLLLIPAALLIPLFVLGAGNKSPALIGIGCLGVGFSFLLFFLVALVGGILAQKAVVLTAAEQLTAMEALRMAWYDLRHDFGRHILVFLVMMAVSIGVSGIFSMAGFAAGIAGQGVGALFAFPVRIAINVASTAVSTALGCWYLATFAALAQDRKP